MSEHKQVTVVAGFHMATGNYMGANVYSEPITDQRAIERAMEYVAEGNEMTMEEVANTYRFEVTVTTLDY